MASRRSGNRTPAGGRRVVAGTAPSTAAPVNVLDAVRIQQLQLQQLMQQQTVGMQQHMVPGGAVAMVAPYMLDAASMQQQLQYQQCQQCMLGGVGMFPGGAVATNPLLVQQQMQMMNLGTTDEQENQIEELTEEERYVNKCYDCLDSNFKFSEATGLDLLFKLTERDGYYYKAMEEVLERGGYGFVTFCTKDLPQLEEQWKKFRILYEDLSKKGRAEEDEIDGEIAELQQQIKGLEVRKVRVGAKVAVLTEHNQRVLGIAEPAIRNFHDVMARKRLPNQKHPGETTNRRKPTRRTLATNNTAPSAGCADAEEEDNGSPWATEVSDDKEGEWLLEKLTSPESFFSVIGCRDIYSLGADERYKESLVQSTEVGGDVFVRNCNDLPKFEEQLAKFDVASRKAETAAIVARQKNQNKKVSLEREAALCDQIEQDLAKKCGDLIDAREVKGNANETVSMFRGRIKKMHPRREAKEDTGIESPPLQDENEEPNLNNPLPFAFKESNLAHHFNPDGSLKHDFGSAALNNNEDEEYNKKWD